MTDMVDQYNTIQVTPIKINGKSWTPPAESKRINPETGIYNNKPNDPEYFNKYYNDKKQSACRMSSMHMHGTETNIIKTYEK